MAVKNSWLAVLLITSLFMTAVECDYVLQVQAHNYRNDGSTDSNGFCCDSAAFPPCTIFFFVNECDNRFTFCLQFAGTSTNTASCPLGIYTTGVIGDDNFNFQTPIASDVPNPMIFTGTTWPGGFQFVVQVFDEDFANNDDHIDDIYINFNTFSPSSSFTSGSYNGIFGNSRIQLGFRLQCTENYYGSDCAMFCVDTDDDTGHYSCSSTGEIVCLSGWNDPNGNCLKPICMTGCDPTGGYCDTPGACLCNEGWVGALCEILLPIVSTSTPGIFQTITPTTSIPNSVMTSPSVVQKVTLSSSTGTTVVPSFASTAASISVTVISAIDQTSSIAASETIAINTTLPSTRMAQNVNATSANLLFASTSVLTLSPIVVTSISTGLPVDESSTQTPSSTGSIVSSSSSVQTSRIVDQTSTVPHSLVAQTSNILAIVATRTTSLIVQQTPSASTPAADETPGPVAQPGGGSVDHTFAIAVGVSVGCFILIVIIIAVVVIISLAVVRRSTTGSVTFKKSPKNKSVKDTILEDMYENADEVFLAMREVNTTLRPAAAANPLSFVTSENQAYGTSTMNSMPPVSRRPRPSSETSSSFITSVNQSYVETSTVRSNASNTLGNVESIGTLRNQAYGTSSNLSTIEDEEYIQIDTQNHEITEEYMQIEKDQPLALRNQGYSEYECIPERSDTLTYEYIQHRFKAPADYEIPVPSS